MIKSIFIIRLTKKFFIISFFFNTIFGSNLVESNNNKVAAHKNFLKKYLFEISYLSGISISYGSASLFKKILSQRNSSFSKKFFFIPFIPGLFTGYFINQTLKELLFKEKSIPDSLDKIAIYVINENEEKFFYNQKENSLFNDLIKKINIDLNNKKKINENEKEAIYWSAFDTKILSILQEKYNNKKDKNSILPHTLTLYFIARKKKFTTKFPPNNWPILALVRTQKETNSFISLNTILVDDYSEIKANTHNNTTYNLIEFKKEDNEYIVKSSTNISKEIQEIDLTAEEENKEIIGIHPITITLLSRDVSVNEFIKIGH